MSRCVKYSLIGYPLGHSFSPKLHGILFNLSGVRADYSLMEIEPDKLDKAIDILKGLDGFNATIPYKTEIIKYLDEMDSRASLYSSVNTVKVNNGRLKGYNTDADGFLTALGHNNIPLKGSVLLIGYGGVSRMMGYEAALAGCELLIAARSKSLTKAENLKNEIISKTNNPSVWVIPLERAEEYEYDLILNGSPVGMYPHTADSPLNTAAIAKAKAAVFDTIFNPAETLLVKTALNSGIPAVGGLTMLIFQAVAAHKIWYNKEFTKEEIDTVIKELSE